MGRLSLAVPRLVGALALFAATTGGAQQTAPVGLEEIIVTAQRRSERLQDVPISVSALSGEALESYQISSPDDLVGFVPNLQAVSAVGQGTPIFSLRGVSMADYSLNQSAPVATYVDEVYKGNFAQLGVSMFDLERIEVLRGPQGTLYGKNTTGGAVNLISRAPSSEFDAYLQAEYGNYDWLALKGALQAPVGQSLSGRIAFSYAQADGWFENLIHGQENPNGTDEYGVRVSLKFEPAEDFSAILRLSSSKRDPRSTGVSAVTRPNGVGNGVYALFNSIYPTSNPNLDYFRTGLGKYQLESNYTRRRTNEADSVSLNAVWNVAEALTLTSVSSYDYGTLLDPQNTDGSPLATLEIDYYDRARSISQDLRLASRSEGPFNFLIGLYYNDEHVFNSTNLKFFQDVDLNGDALLDFNDCVDSFALPEAALHGIGCQFQNGFNQEKVSYAVYSDVAFATTDSITLRAGLRYTRDTGRLTNYRSIVAGSDGIGLLNLIPGSPDLAASTSRRFEQDEFSGRLGLDYRPAPNILWYASAGRGYRGAAFNAQAFFDPSELTIAEPEIIDAYEIGFKSQWLDHELQINGAAFHYDYENQQLIDIDPVTSAQLLLSIPKSEIDGIEFELVWRMLANLTVSGGLGLLSSKITEGRLQGQSVVGNELANAPESSLTLALDWDIIDTSPGCIALHLDGSSVSGQFFEVNNKPRLRQPGYSLLNGRLSFVSADDHWEIAVWGRNLTDEYYTTSRLDISGFGFDWYLLGEPRMYGVSVAVRY